MDFIHKIIHPDRDDSPSAVVTRLKCWLLQITVSAAGFQFTELRQMGANKESSAG